MDGKPAPLELVVWEMAEHFGWTLEYVEGLSVARLHQWQQITDGRGKGQQERERREKFLRNPKGGR